LAKVLSAELARKAGRVDCWQNAQRTARLAAQLGRTCELSKPAVIAIFDSTPRRFVSLCEFQKDTILRLSTAKVHSESAPNQQAIHTPPPDPTQQLSIKS
jgi:hypothetical protein